jgi:hypothetical protein
MINAVPILVFVWNYLVSSTVLEEDVDLAKPSAIQYKRHEEEAYSIVFIQQLTEVLRDLHINNF